MLVIYVCVVISSTYDVYICECDCDVKFLSLFRNLTFAPFTYFLVIYVFFYCRFPFVVYVCMCWCFIVSSKTKIPKIQ